MNNRQIQGRRSRQDGKIFEAIVDAACRYYQERGVAAIAKTPEPMKIIKNMPKGQFLCCFEKSAEPDYKGVLDGGTTILFDAKATEEDRIQSSRITETQYETFEQYEKLGAVCFVLISLDLQQFYRVPWADWKQMKARYGHKYMNEAELEPYRIPSRMGYPLFLEKIEYTPIRVNG